jgi:hypothetical protein
LTVLYHVAGAVLLIACGSLIASMRHIADKSDSLVVPLCALVAIFVLGLAGSFLFFTGGSYP